MNRTLFLVGFLFICSPAFAQGVVSERGFGLQGGFSSQDDVTTYSGRAGFVAEIIEYGASVSHSSGDIADLSALSVSPFVGLYPVRQSDAFPFSIRLGAAFGFTSFSGDEVDRLEDFGVDVSGTNVALSGSVFSEVETSPAFRIIPLAEVGYSSTTLKLEANGDSESQTEDAVVFSGSLIFALGRPSSSVFTVGPSVSVSEGETVFGITLGVVIPS